MYNELFITNIFVKYDNLFKYSKGKIIMLLNNLKSILFTKTQLQKLSIIYSTYPTKIATSTLESQCNIPKKELKRTIINLNEEICEFEILEEISNAILIKGGFVYLSSEVNSKKYASIIMKLRKKYLLSSSVYKALLFCFEQRVFKLSDLADHLFYSDSYTYKVIKKLKNFFDYLESDIKLVKKSKTDLFIEGNESSIRIFHYLLVMLVSEEDNWIFKSISIENIETCYSNEFLEKFNSLTNCNKTRIRNVLAVCEMAIKKNYYLSNISSSVIALGKVMNSEEENSIYLTCTKLLGVQEQIYLSFIMNYFCQELRSREQKIIIGIKYSKLKNNMLIQLVINFLNDINIYTPLSKKNYYELLYTLCKRIIVIHHFGLHKFMCENNFIFYKGDTERHIEHLVEKHFNEYKNEKSFNMLKYSLIPLTASYVKLSTREALKVYVEFQHHSEYRSMIINKLKLNYSKSLLKIVDNYDNADIVISDIPSSERKKNLFLFHRISDADTWKYLREFINNILENE